MEETTHTTDVLNPFAVHGRNGPQTALTEATVQREIAEVQAALLIAKRFPRDPVQAVDRILQACTRPQLASAALYQYARGGADISGPSIRLAEAIAQQWGNLICGVSEIARRPGESECIAYAWDLETNFRDDRRFLVKHVRNTRRGNYVVTDERDVYEMIANQGARRKRACILTVVPGDVVEAAIRQVEVTLQTNIRLTPDRLKAMLETFEEYSVTKDMIEARIQRRIDAITPALFIQLGKIANSLKDGMSEPADWFEIHAATPASSESAQVIKEKLVARKPQRQTTPPAPDEAGTAPAGPTEQPLAPGEAGAPYQLSELVKILRNRLVRERAEHRSLPEPWQTWERELGRLSALQDDSPEAARMVSALLDALQ